MKPQFTPPHWAAALHAPVAPYTWEVQALLRNSVQETPRVPLRWNRPVCIVGMYPSVVAYDIDGQLITPTTDEIAVYIGANQKDRFTNRLDQGVATGLAESYVTLAAVGIQAPRLWDLRLENDAPQVDVSFRWKTNTITSPTHENAYCSLAFYCYYL